MKLLYITNGISGPGGLERVLSIKASYLAEKYNYDVHILTLNQTTTNLFYEFSPKIVYHNVEAKGNPITYFLKYRQGIKQTIKKVVPHIIIICDDGLKGVLFPILFNKTCPTIYERHVSKNIEIKSDKQSLKQTIVSSFKFKLMNLGARKFDKFIVLTKGNTNEWNLKNLIVIPNPLSFYSDEKSTLENKKVIAVGKQSFQKGYDRLLKSWEIVAKKHPDWILEIFGTINESEELDKLAKKLKIEGQVKFHPPVKNISDKYKEASIYTMSSRYEGFGMVLTEAMAYGIPCISYNCPYGPSDIIDHKKNGYIIPNGNISEFGNCINTLIEDVTKRKKFGKQAKLDVQRFLPENILQKWNTLFLELTANAIKK